VWNTIVPKDTVTGRAFRAQNLILTPLPTVNVRNLLEEIAGDTLLTEEHFHVICRHVHDPVFVRHSGGFLRWAEGESGG